MLIALANIIKKGQVDQHSSMKQLSIIEMHNSVLVCALSRVDLTQTKKTSHHVDIRSSNEYENKEQIQVKQVE